MSCGDIFLGVIAIFFPPIAVWVKSGLCSADSLINILLCMLGYVPGLLHAWYIIAKYPEPDHDYDPVDNAESGRGGRVTYYYVSHEPSSRRQNQQGQQRTYGTQQQSGTAATNKSVSATQWQGQSQQQGESVAGSSHQPQQPARSSEGAGSHAEGAPPSYSDVVKGDNKVQTQH